MTRALLTAATIGTLTGVALTFGPHGAVGIAVCAAGVIAWYLVRAVRRDRRRAWDKARHPASAPWYPSSAPWYFVRDTPTAITETVVHPARGLTIIKGGKESDWLLADLKPWPIGDDEVRR